MALLLIEGFEDYGTSTTGNLSSTIVGERYNATSALRLNTGRLTGYSCGCYGSATDIITPPLTTNSTIVVGGAFRYLGTPTASAIISLYDGATLGVNLSYDGTNLVIKRGATSLGSVATALTAAVWIYIELKVLCNSSTGTATLKVNNSTVLTLTSQNTQAGGHAWHDIVDFFFQGSATGSWDDIYILDGSGSVNNDFLGPQKVLCMYPTGDSGSEQWTTSTGATHYNLVNEQVEDADTTYVVNSAPGQLDMFAYGGLSGTGTIAGIQINTAVRETDTNSHSLITRVISGGTTSDDSGQGVANTSYTNRRRLLDTDPNTSAAWTLAALNAATFGFIAG